jgi:hypothetical protein
MAGNRLSRKLTSQSQNQRGAKSTVPQNKSARRNFNEDAKAKQKVPKAKRQKLNYVPVKVDRSWFEADVDRAIGENGTHVKKLVHSIISQDTQYTMPRPITTTVNSNRYKFVQDIVISAAEAADPNLCKVAILLRPDPNKLLSIGRTIVTATIPSGDAWMETRESSSEWKTQDMSLPFSLVDVNGRHHGVEFDEKLPFVIQAGGKLPQLAGGYVLPASVTTTAPTTFRVTLLNGENQSFSSTCKITAYTGTLGNLTSASNMSLTATASSGGSATFDFQAQVGFAAFWATLASSTFFGFDIVQTSTIEYDPGKLNINLEYSSFALDSGFSWTDYTLWDVVANSQDIKNIFVKSDSYSVTGMNCIFQNNTPALSKGGTVYAARLPGGSEPRLPRTFDKMQDVLRNIRDYNFKETNLDRGLFWYYTPEKVTDLYFNSTDESGRRPYAGVTFTIPSGISGSFIMTMQGSINLELITYNPALSLTRAQANEPLLSALCAALSELSGWSHNPNHIQHITAAVKSVMNNDQVKMVLKSMLAAGVKLAPMVIAALA